MTSLSDHAKGELLDHLTGQATMTTPTNLYLCLLKSGADDTDTGTTITSGGHEITTPATNGYDREEVTPDGGAMSAEGATTKGQSETTAIVTFGPFTADLSAATHWALCDATTGGNMWLHGSLESSKDPENGGSIVFAAGEFKLIIS